MKSEDCCKSGKSFAWNTMYIYEGRCVARGGAVIGGGLLVKCDT